MDNNILKDVSILIVGYDGYLDVWNHCVNLLNIYWHNRPETYLATSVLKPKYDGVVVVPAGPNTEWSSKARTALEKIETKYVILMLEDFFITDYVNNDDIAPAINLMNKHNILYYQLNLQLANSAFARGKKFNKSKYVRVVNRKEKYPINLQAAIWRRDFLLEKLGKENYNAWRFELNNVYLPNLNKDTIECLFDKRNVLHITHAIVQSKYLPSALKKMKRIGYSIDESERKTMSKSENFKYNLKLLMYTITPRFLIRPFKAIGKLFGMDYVTDRVNKQ